MIRLTPKANWKQFNHPLGGAWYSWGYVRACVTQDGPDKLWHLSVSCEYRYPTWNEIYTAWYDLVPDAAEIEGAIILPRKSEYVNLMDTCFHVFQLRDSEIGIDPSIAIVGRLPR